MKVLLSSTARIAAQVALFDSYRLSVKHVTTGPVITYDFLSKIHSKKSSLMLDLAGESAAAAGAGVSGSDSGSIIGFAHLYPGFSSVSMMRIFSVSDIYVKGSNVDETRAGEEMMINNIERLLLSAGVKRVLVQTYHDHTREILTHKGFSPDPFVYYSKSLEATSGKDGSSGDVKVSSHARSSAINITRATGATAELIDLFDKYRIFYKKGSDKAAGAAYISERLDKKESVVLVASYDDRLVGFLQLYPGYSSSNLDKTYTINDLYVDESARNNGVATHLIFTAEEFLRSNDVWSVCLKTSPDNPARKLYERLGFTAVSDSVWYIKNLEAEASEAPSDLLALTGAEISEYTITIE